MAHKDTMIHMNALGELDRFGEGGGPWSVSAPGGLNGSGGGGGLCSVGALGGLDGFGGGEGLCSAHANLRILDIRRGEGGRADTDRCSHSRNST